MVTSYATSSDVDNSCVVCKTEKHPLYISTKFKAVSPEDKMRVVKVNHLCTNCLSSRHFCKCVHNCKVCQKSHHTLLHSEVQNKASPRSQDRATAQADTPVGSHAATRLKSDVLLMTCHVLITAPDHSIVEARALLDNASSASFIFERLVHSLSLPCTNQSIRVSGIGGISHKPSIQSVTRFQLSSLQPSGRKINVTAVVVQVTCNLPIKPATFEIGWTHLSDLPLADPGFGQPGRIDILLVADVFVEVLHQGQRNAPTCSTIAFETGLGWVLCGTAGFTSTSMQANVHITTFHTSATSSDDVL